MTDHSHAPGWDHIRRQCASNAVAVHRQVEDLVERTVAPGPSFEGTLECVRPGSNLRLDCLDGSSTGLVAPVGSATCLEKTGYAMGIMEDEPNAGIEEAPASFQRCDATHSRSLLQ